MAEHGLASNGGGLTLPIPSGQNNGGLKIETAHLGSSDHSDGGQTTPSQKRKMSSMSSDQMDEPAGATTRSTTTSSATNRNNSDPASFRIETEDCISPLSTKTMDSQREFAMSHQTILIFDWDDTLCPSTFCRTELADDLICRIWRETCAQAQKTAEALPETTAEKLNKGDMAVDEAEKNKKDKKKKNKRGAASDTEINSRTQHQNAQEGGEDQDDVIEPGSTYSLNRPDESLQHLYVSEQHRELLSEVTDSLIEVLQNAQQAGKVVIVTNAETGWIELSCRAWLPRAYDEVMKCQLVSARSRYEPEGVNSPAGWKARAFRDVVDIFYGEFRSWKNIISIGDAPHEREAVFRITADNAHPKCRTKSIKLMVKPQPRELLHQLNILNLHLDKIVALDNGLDLEFDKTQGTFL